jgi:hypothetical protein
MFVMMSIFVSTSVTRFVFLVEGRVGNSRLGVYRRNLCEVVVSKAQVISS